MADQDQLALLRQGAEQWNTWRKEHPEAACDLSKAYLSFTDLSRANLSEARLSNTILYGADLRAAYLTGANLIETNFSRADLAGATVGLTKFTDIDIRGVKGLETIHHGGPSSVGIDTLYLSQGQIPESFLRQAGVPENFLTDLPLLMNRALEYYTCLISYASQNEDFAQRLYADLQAKGVRCWFAPQDLKIGDKIRPRIDESIRLYDKLLLILSKHSVASQRVEQEVETALAKERRAQHTVLFPIRLDNAVMEIEVGWPTFIRNTRNIGDFTQLERHDVYQKSFDRLLHDLKADTQR